METHVNGLATTRSGAEIYISTCFNTHIKVGRMYRHIDKAKKVTTITLSSLIDMLI